MAPAAIGFNAHALIVPALLCIWVLVWCTFSPPEDWKASRFGTSPILPPTLMKLLKTAGRAGVIATIGFSMLTAWRHPQRTYAIRALLPLILFVAYALVSVVWSPLRSVSLTQAGSFAMLILLSTYIAIIWDGDQTSQQLVTHLAIGLFALTLVLIALHFVMPRSGALTKESAGVMHSTNASSSAGLGILLTVAARTLWNAPWTRWWLPIVAIQIASMLIGGNRLSVLVTAVVVCLFLAIHIDRGMAAICVFLISMFGIVYLVVDPRLSVLEDGAKELGMFAKQGQSQSELGSLSGRAEMWEKMWRSYSKSPLLGHGYFVTSPRGRIYVWHEWGNWTAHNFWLQALVTTGAIGLSMLAGGLAWLAWGVVRGAAILKQVEPSVWLIAAVSLWFFGWAFLNSSFIGPLQPESVVFSVIAGIAAGISAKASCQLDRGRSDNDVSLPQGGVA